MNRWHVCKAGARYYTWPEFWKHKLSGKCSKPLLPGQREVMEKALREAAE